MIKMDNMDNTRRDDKTQKNKKLSNPVIVGIIELAIFYVGAVLYSIAYFLIRLFAKSQDAVVDEFLDSFFLNAFYIIIIMLCLLFMKKTRPETLKVFSKGAVGERVCKGLIGALIGFIMNAFVSSMVAITGTGQFSFNGFSIFIILIVPAVIIQCSMEEFLCRGFVPEYLREHGHIIIITVGGICFILHHVSNMLSYGFSAIFCMNVFLVGAIMYLLVQISGNFWIACGFHSAWNYTQQYLFGIPNSGLTSNISLFQGTELQKNFFFDPVYGNEGSMMTTICVLVVFAVLVVCMVRQKKW